MSKYLKLGKKAKEGSFWNAATKTQLSGDQVVKVKNLTISNKAVVQALNRGHIVLSNEEEYKKFLQTNADARRRHQAEVAARKVVKEEEQRIIDEEERLAAEIAEDEEEDNLYPEDDDEDQDVDLTTLNKEDLIKEALTYADLTVTEDEMRKSSFTKADIISEIEDLNGE